MHTPSHTLLTLATMILLFGMGTLVGVGLSHFERGNLLSGLLFSLLGAAMVWALLLKRPHNPEVE